MSGRRSIPSPARHAGLLVTLGLHALLGAALLAYEPARTTALAAAPLMVSLITAPKPEAKPEPPVEIIPPPPKPKPTPKPVVKPRPQLPEPPPVLAAATPAPAPIEAPAAPAEVAPPPPPAPPPAVTAPIFNADYLKNPPPAYPPLSRRTGEEGRVILRVLVSPAGTADAIEIRTSSGHKRLDQAALEAVQAWRFVPAKRAAQPVAAWVLVPISFRLQG